MKSMRALRPRTAAMSVPRKRIAPDVGCGEIEDHARKRGLAASGLADDREYLGPVGRYREAHIVDRAEGGAAEQAAARIDLGDVLDGKQVGAHETVAVGASSTGRTAGIRRETRDAMAWRQRRQRRHLAPADVHRKRAARMKAAARRRRGEIRRRAVEPLLRRDVADARQALDEVRGYRDAADARRSRASAPPPPGGRRT